MNCNACVKINPVPSCLDGQAPYSYFYLTDIVFDESDTDMFARIRNTATGRIVYYRFTTEPDGEGLIDIYEILPLMENQYYEVKFFNESTNQPASFTITNSDDSEETGCCIEFESHDGLETDDNYYRVSTKLCSI